MPDVPILQYDASSLHSHDMDLMEMINKCFLILVAADKSESEDISKAIDKITNHIKEYPKAVIIFGLG